MVAAGAAYAGSPPGAHVLDSRSRLYPDSERTMGFDVGSTGLRIVLDAAVPEVIGRYVREDVDGFLADHGLDRRRHRLVGLPPRRPQGDRGAAGDARACPARPSSSPGTRWRAIGNLSSASVLHVLEDTLRERPPAPGQPRAS